MNTTVLLTAVQNGARRIPMALVVAAAVTFLQQNAAAITTIDYGAAASFSVLAGSAITDAGGASQITTGNAGVYPGTSDGLLASQVTGGTIYARPVDDGLLLGAQNAFGAAFTAAAGEPVTAILGLQLGGQNLLPGIYTFNAGTVLLGGTLTLNANGALNPVWIFLATSDLTTASASSIVFENGGVPCDVLWRVPTQATLGSSSLFVGTIMAGSAIEMDTGATLDGRAWAGTAVTLDHNTISGLPCTSLADTGGTGGTTVPDAGSTLPLLGIGVLGLLAFLEVGGRSSTLAQNRRAIS